jgi:uncharacterized protein with gpF-like domain
MLIHPAPHERSVVHRARFQIANVVASALTATTAEAAAKIRRRKRREADELDDDDQIDQQTADDVSKGIDLTGLITPVGLALGYVAQDQVSRVMGRLGDLSEIEPTAQRAAVKLAQDQAARLVGMRYDDAGALVENPNPKWSITASTRDMLHDLISDGVAQNQSADEIADRIVTSTGFSAGRAQTIAVTEVSTADNAGFLLSLKTATIRVRSASTMKLAARSASMISSTRVMTLHRGIPVVTVFSPGSMATEKSVTHKRKDSK